MAKGAEHDDPVRGLGRRRGRKLHFDDVVCDKPIGKMNLGVVFKGTFLGNNDEVKKMKENSMAELIDEVTMLDTFRCNFIVHFNGACVIPNHFMTGTEFAASGSLANSIMKQPRAVRPANQG